MIFLSEMTGLPSFYDQRFVRYRIWPILTSFGPFLSLMGIFELFQSPERYEICETLIKTWCFWVKWGVNQVSRRRGSRDIGVDPNFTPILTHFGHFWALWVIWGVYNVWNTNRKVGLAVSLRGQTSFYGHPFTRYQYLPYFGEFPQKYPFPRPKIIPFFKNLN